MNKSIDIVGKKFNRLTAVKLAFKKGSGKNVRHFWIFKCVCGKEKILNKYQVMSGHTKSCGCFFNERVKVFNKTHGFSKTRLEGIYSKLKGRCDNINDQAYKHYGGRGIKCAWHSFEKFKDDMYESYKLHIKKFGEKDTTIDRIDNNGNYCKENCRWATFKIQQRNRRNNRLITFNDKTKCIAEWAVILNMRYGLLYQRIYRDKLTIQKAFTKKV
jgi:hypothetical protein